MLYKDLKPGDVFKVYRNSLVTFRRDKEGSTQLTDADGSKYCRAVNKCYFYSSMTVYPVYYR